MHTVDLTLPDVGLNFAAARAAADAVAQPLSAQVHGEPMLLAWFDGKNDVGYPQGQECTGTTPGWLAYAKSHGGDLRVNVNHHAFIFIFAVGLAPERG